MKSSRAMLLAAMLFAVPAFANEPAKADGQTEQATNEPAKVDPAPAKEEPKKEEVKEEPKKAEDSKEADASKKDEAKAEDKKEEAKEGLFATALKYGKMPFVAVLFTMPDAIAKNTLGKIAAMDCLKDGKFAAFLGHEYTGRAAVFGSAALITYLVWNATQAEDVDADDNDIFIE